MTTGSEPATTELEPDEPHESRDPLTRVIAISLASVVVFGAALATLQTDASVHESTTARETTRVAVRALRANVTESAVVGTESELQGEKAFLAYRRPLTEGSPSLTDAVGIPRDRRGLSRQLRAATEGLPIARAQEAIDRLSFETERATLKQKALATTRITWNTRSTQYTTVIAVLAAALFLVGFGLVVEGRLRVYSYGLGMAIAVVVALLAVRLYFLPIPSTPDEAIAAAARAHVREANRDYEGAIAQYDRSLAIDDEFAAAYRGRAIARLLAANPDYSETRAVTDLEGRASEAALRDTERALELEKRRDFIALALLALQAFYAEDYARSLEGAVAAIELNPEDPDVRLLKSAAETALGRPAAARSSLQGAIDLLRDTDPSQRNRLLASTYLSYLEWVAWSVPERATEVRTLEDEVVAVETAFTLDRQLSRTLPAGGKVEVLDLRYDRGRLNARMPWRGLPKGTTLSALAYERPLANGPWAQPTDLALFLSPSGDGERRISVPLERTCKPTEVRVDLYLNGAPAGSETGPGVPATC